MFKRSFLGTSRAALKCTIENINDITFIYKKKSGALEAFCDKPILIRNPALGYKISYYLDKFLTSDNSTSYEGHHYFEDDSLIKGRARKKIRRNREDAYRGSRMHFIRSAYNNTLGKEGFRVFNSVSELLNSDILVVGLDSRKGLKINDKLQVHYQNQNVFQKSYLTRNKDLTLINDNGFYDPSGITWTGYMARERVGDLLPFEYQLNTRNANP
ncbi:MAG TPA: hypothetical protein VGB63_04640 [Pedobacter sp.]